MIIDTIIILTLSISFPLEYDQKMQEGGRLTLRKKVPLPSFNPPTISRSKIYGPSIISPPARTQCRVNGVGRTVKSQSDLSLINTILYYLQSILSFDNR